MAAKLLLLLEGIGVVRFRAERRVVVAEDHSVSPDDAETHAELSQVTEVFLPPGAVALLVFRVFFATLRALVVVATLARGTTSAAER